MAHHSVLFRNLGLIGLLLCGFLLASPASATRVKDIADLEGVRENQLMGYGLVIGLNGTGDDVKKSLFTRQSIINMVERLGITMDSAEATKLKTENVAAVMVTAALPPFASPGSTLDVMVSSIGDASSLAGGSLLMTPLKAVDGKVYAVAQGPLTVGSISYGGKAAKVQKNHPTVGRITGGAVVERTANFALPDNSALTYHLKSPDFSSAAQMVASINKQYGPGTARAVDSGNVLVTPPPSFDGNVVAFVADLEHLDMVTDAPARIVVNERTGTIVMGKDVRISTVAVSHGNLNLVITESAAVSQPNPLASGGTVVVQQTAIKVTEENGNLVVLEMGVSIGEIARALNAIGATPRDLIAIFQAMKAAGALHGELVVL